MLRDVDTWSGAIVVVWFDKLVAIILHLLTAQIDTFRYKYRIVQGKKVTNNEETSSEVE